MKLFQYAVIGTTTEDPPQTVRVIEISSKMAKDEETLRLWIAREIPDQWADKLDQLEVLVRPF